jgi:hypothetical protein
MPAEPALHDASRPVLHSPVMTARRKARFPPITCSFPLLMGWAGANPRGGADRALLAGAPRASRFSIAATRRARVSALSGDDPFRECGEGSCDQRSRVAPPLLFQQIDNHLRSLIAFRQDSQAWVISTHARAPLVGTTIG